MFYYLNGTVAEIAAGLAVIDCGGVGYACATTNYTLSQLKKGEKARLYTYLHVREDIFEAPRQHWPFCLPPRPRIWPCPL